MPDQPTQFKIQRNGELILVEPLDYETQDRLNFSVVATNGRQVRSTPYSVVRTPYFVRSTQAVRLRLKFSISTLEGSRVDTLGCAAAHPWRAEFKMLTRL